MEHSVAPYHLSLPILKHLLGLPVAFSDLEFTDAELHRNLKWLRANTGAATLGLDFTVTLESFGVKEVAELIPGGKDRIVNDDNKEEYLEVRAGSRSGRLGEGGSVLGEPWASSRKPRCREFHLCVISRPPRDSIIGGDFESVSVNFYTLATTSILSLGFFKAVTQLCATKCARLYSLTNIRYPKQ